MLLKFLYLGWEYQGYATQEDTANTIEHHLFSALVRCCLVESRQTSNYGRCGRTDKGVSSFCQVDYYMFVPHFSVWVSARVYSLSYGAETAVRQSSTTIAATLVVLPVATIILTSLSGVNVCTVFCLTSWEHGSFALRLGLCMAWLQCTVASSK